jgi:hypothetical protein
VLLALIIFLFIYDFHLYLLARNTYHRIHHDRNIRFSSIASEIINDSKSIFLFSIGFILVFIVLIIPILPIGFNGILYSGIMHPLLFFLSCIIGLFITIKYILFSYIAYRTRSVKSNLKGIFRLLAVENINIPFYMVLIWVISGAFFSVMLYVIFTGFYMTLIPLLGSSAPQALSDVNLYSFPGLLGIPGNFSDLYSNLSIAARAGITLVAIFSFIILLLSAAYYINLTLSLSAVSVYIMDSNPGRSLNRSVIVAACFIGAVILLVLFLAVIPRLRF